MRLDKVKDYIFGMFKENAVYFALIAPALLMLVAILYNANMLWFLFLIVWFCAGLMIVFIPSNPETNDH